MTKPTPIPPLPVNAETEFVLSVGVFGGIAFSLLLLVGPVAGG